MVTLVVFFGENDLECPKSTFRPWKIFGERITLKVSPHIIGKVIQTAFGEIFAFENKKCGKKHYLRLHLGFFLKKKVDLLPKPQKWSHKWLFDIINIFGDRTTLKVSPDTIWKATQPRFVTIFVFETRKWTYNITFVVFFL